MRDPMSTFDPEPSLTNVGFAASDLRIARPAGARAGRHWKRLTFSWHDPSGVGIEWPEFGPRWVRTSIQMILGRKSGATQ